MALENAASAHFKQTCVQISTGAGQYISDC